MPGHKPIFATLISSIFLWLRDSLYRAVLEPASPAQRRAKRIRKIRKDKKSQG